MKYKLTSAWIDGFLVVEGQTGKEVVQNYLKLNFSGVRISATTNEPDGVTFCLTTNGWLFKAEEYHE